MAALIILTNRVQIPNNKNTSFVKCICSWQTFPIIKESLTWVKIILSDCIKHFNLDSAIWMRCFLALFICWIPDKGLKINLGSFVIVLLLTAKATKQLQRSFRLKFAILRLQKFSDKMFLTVPYAMIYEYCIQNAKTHLYKTGSRCPSHLWMLFAPLCSCPTLFRNN